MVTVTASMPVKAQDEGDCYLMDAPQIGEGWQRKVCSNSDYDSWISPSGEECLLTPSRVLQHVEKVVQKVHQ
jgi:hypothetical protein